MCLLVGRQNVRLFVDKDMPSIDLWRLIGTACELALLLPYAGLEWAQRESSAVDDLEAPLLVSHTRCVAPRGPEILMDECWSRILGLRYATITILLRVGKWRQFKEET